MNAVFSAMLAAQRRSKTDAEFFGLIRDKPLARNLFVAYCRQNEYLDQLKAYYYYFQMPVEAAELAVLEAYRSERWRDRMSGLDIAKAFFAKEKEKDKEYSLEHQVFLSYHCYI